MHVSLRRIECVLKASCLCPHGCMLVSSRLHACVLTFACICPQGKMLVSSRMADVRTQAMNACVLKHYLRIYQQKRNILCVYPHDIWCLCPHAFLLLSACKLRVSSSLFASISAHMKLISAASMRHLLSSRHFAYITNIHFA